MDESTAAAYGRPPETRGKAMPYEQKFSKLIELCEKAKTVGGVKNVIVTWPWVIGDTYEEMTESLSRISEAGLALHIVHASRDDDSTPPCVNLN